MTDAPPFHLRGNFAPVEAERTVLEPEVVGARAERVELVAGASPEVGEQLLVGVVDRVDLPEAAPQRLLAGDAVCIPGVPDEALWQGPGHGLVVHFGRQFAERTE